MTFSAAEAELILREQWDDAELVGGFLHSFERDAVLKELVDQFGGDLDGYTLIGHTFWNDFEEGGETFLFSRDSDQTFWTFAQGSTVYGSYGESFYDEVSAANITDWLERVATNIEHRNNFVGC